MKSKKSILGELGLKFFSLMQLKNQEIVSLGELQPILQISKKQEKELLSRLANNGYIVRLCRGTYLVPQKLPPGGIWAPDEYTIIYELMKLLKANYQICGPLAFQKYGLSTQIPNGIAIYNNKKSGLVTVGKTTLKLIKVSNQRIGSTDQIRLSNGKEIYISNLARTIMDGVYDYSRFNSLPRAFDWIRKYSKDPAFITELINATINYSNVNTMRRIGFFLDKLGIKDAQTNRILLKLKKTQSWITLIPDKNMKGVTNKKWAIIDNAVP